MHSRSLDLEDETQDITSLERILPQTSLKRSQLEALRNDDDVLNAEIQEEEMNMNDKEYKDEEIKEKEIWDPETALHFMQTEMTRECDDPFIEDPEERERILKIFNGESHYEPDPQLETLYLEWRKTHPEERPPLVKEKKRNAYKILDSRKDALRR